MHKNSKQNIVNLQVVEGVLKDNKKVNLSKGQISSLYNERMPSGKQVSTSTLFRVCEKMDFLCFKSPFSKTSFTPSTALTLQHRLFLTEVAGFLAEFVDFVFVDETTIYPHDYKSERWLVKHRPCFASKPKRQPSLKLIAAISYKGLVSFSISEENTNQFGFSKFLAKTSTKLKQMNLLPGDADVKEVVVLDNARWHITGRVKQEAYKQKLTMVFLPAYSPHFNAIEMFFADLKQKLRKTAFETQRYLLIIGATARKL